MAAETEVNTMDKMSTLCYIECGGKYLMLHRVVKENDVNHYKWIGVGGHFEFAESPDECLEREVMEETGLKLASHRFRGIVTFIYGSEPVVEYMHLFTAEPEIPGIAGGTGRLEQSPAVLNPDNIPLAECNEGVLEWVDIDRIHELELWEGDRIFFRLLAENLPFFSLKLVYDEADTLKEAVLDGVPLELFDVLDDNGCKTGVVRERGVCHRDGTAHAAAHIWVVRRHAGRLEVLLQKRSAEKDSNPGSFDTSAAGHVAAGDTVIEAAVRELEEELGITADPAELEYLGIHHNAYQDIFHGRVFRDNEFISVYAYYKDVDEKSLTLQETEVESVRWMSVDECLEVIGDAVYGSRDDAWPNCIYAEELRMIKERYDSLKK